MTPRITTEVALETVGSHWRDDGPALLKRREGRNLTR